jgi:ABC-type uncharacterized transport system involved in gliding motility auxiliary subunit
VNRLLGALGWLGVVLVVAAVVIRFTRPDLQEWSRGLAMSGLAVTVLYALSQWRDIARSFGGREVKYGSIAATGAVLVLGILVGVNWLASRQNWRWDLTESNQFSLSEQTVQILRSLDRPVTIRVFYAGSSQAERDRLTEYTYHSNRVNVEYVDAERNPLEAQRYEVTSVPTYLIEYEGRTERALSNSEQTLTNALKRVIEGQPKKIYFLQGHGEPDPEAPDGDGFSALVNALRSDNFEVDRLTLAQQTSVPEDATIVTIAGPKTDLLPAELDALRAFLRRGGKLHLLIDPPDQGKAPDVTGLIALAREWGIDVGNNLLIDASGIGQMLGTDASVPVAMPMSHPITNNFRVREASTGGWRRRSSRRVRRAGPKPTWPRCLPPAASNGTSIRRTSRVLFHWRPRFLHRPKRRRHPPRVKAIRRMPTHQDRKRAWWSLATATSPVTALSAFRATARCS